MITRASLLVVSGSTTEDTIYIGDNEYRNVFDIVLDGIAESDRYYVVDQDRQDRFVWILPTEVMYENGYPQTVAGQLSHLMYLVDYLVVFDLSEQNELCNAHIFSSPSDQGSTDEIATFKGSEKARGYDTADDVREELEIEFEWDWSDFVELYPMVEEI